MSEESPDRSRRARRFPARFLFGWALALLLVGVFSYVALNTLAPWQLGKNQRNSAANHRLEEAFQRPAVPWDTVQAARTQRIEEQEEWTHVTLRGHFVPNTEVIVRNRPVSGAPAYQVLSVFREDSGQKILVNRGFVQPLADGGVPEYPALPTGELSLGGYLRPDEQSGSTEQGSQGAQETQGQGAHAAQEQLVEHAGHRMVTAINSQALARATGQELVAGYVQLDSESATAGVQAIPLPQLRSGPYLSYGIQWIFFGIIAPVGLGWFFYAQLRERRRERTEAQQLAARGTGVQDTQDTNAQQNQAQSATKDGAGQIAEQSNPQPTTNSQGDAALQHTSGDTQQRALTQEEQAELDRTEAQRRSEQKMLDRYGKKHRQF